jgi:hypothetical protein
MEHRFKMNIKEMWRTLYVYVHEDDENGFVEFPAYAPVVPCVALGKLTGTGRPDG